MERPVGTGYDDLRVAWRAVEALGAFAFSSLDFGGSDPLLMAESSNDGGKPVVAISAGVHGDEPAAAWALLSLTRDGLLDERFDYRLWCCTNPSGYRRGTRENEQSSDVNRSFSRDGRTATTCEAEAIERANRGQNFALSLDLHEDGEAEGFYCYEPFVAGTEPLAPHVVAAMLDSGLPVQLLQAGFDLGYPPGAAAVRALGHGRVAPDIVSEVHHFDGLPYSMYLLWTRTARRTLTLESPSRLRWNDRLTMHRIAVTTALALLTI